MAAMGGYDWEWMVSRVSAMCYSGPPGNDRLDQLLNCLLGLNAFKPGIASSWDRNYTIGYAWLF